jgi:3-dehydroshikimate dehydratase
LVVLSGFADEISSDLKEQLSVLESEQISYLEFRGVWSKNVLELTDVELQQVKSELNRKGFRVSSIGSPIGKIGINDDFQKHLVKFERAIHVAKMFQVPYIRIFSFFIPNGEDPDKYRTEVISKMKTLSTIAEKENITLLHENEKGIYGDTAERCLDILESIQSPNLKCAFDPANFIQCGVKPLQAFEILEKYIEYMHIKDAKEDTGKVVPAGEGDGKLEQILKALYLEGYNGFLSLEPHLSAAGTYSGYSGPDLYKIASQSLKKLINNVDKEWLDTSVSV